VIDAAQRMRETVDEIVAMGEAGMSGSCRRNKDEGGSKQSEHDRFLNPAGCGDFGIIAYGPSDARARESGLETSDSLGIDGLHSAATVINFQPNHEECGR
jgi:hypothetical protein